jgi:glycosyltransferase involved in cell wall biosynthesis
MHLELPELLRKCDSPDVVIEDLGHVVPFVSERLTRAPGVVFFRHLHRRTLPGQVNVPARWVLGAIERAYPFIYRRWPFVAPSQSAIADLGALGFDASRLHLIGYGVDFEMFQPGTLSETPSLIYFAGLRRYKRPQHALYALKILIENGVDANLFIVGNGPEQASMMNLSRSLGIEDHVTFTGRLGDTELSALISKSWVHVQCSVAEGWGLTVAEAAASGVPTVAYSVPGLIDSVSPGISGILVEDGNIAALARALGTVIRNRLNWTSRCREAVIGHSWEMVARKWDTLLNQLSNHP